MPGDPYNISGTVYSTITPGRSEIRVTIGTGGGIINQDIYIGGNTQPAAAIDLEIWNLDTNEKFPQTVTTASNGTYIFSASNFDKGYTVGDIIQIIASNVEDSLHDSENGDDQTIHDDRINARRIVMVDKDGNEFTVDNPLPVYTFSDDLFNANGDMDYTHDGTGRLTKETKTINGVSYSRTHIYTGSNYYADRITKWTKD